MAEETTRGKRRFGTPTGDTPGKPKGKCTKKREDKDEAMSRKALFSEQPERKSRDWSNAEIKCLVKYVALYNDGETWPTHKRSAFWDDCSSSVSKCSGMYLRTGDACRTKVVKFLVKKFKTIHAAEEAYGIDYFEDENYYHDNVFTAMDTPKLVDIINNVVDNMKLLTPQERIQMATYVYRYVSENDYNKDLKHFIPDNFLELSLNAMSYLKLNGKDNVVYNLCKCLGEMREDGTTTRMDINRMPFGLISFNCKFFAVDNGNNLQASEDYMKWMETMYSHFGNSWASLHLGPMWSHDDPGKKQDEPKRNIIEEALSSAFGDLSIPDEYSIPLPPTTIPLSPGTPLASTTIPTVLTTIPLASSTLVRNADTDISCTIDSVGTSDLAQLSPGDTSVTYSTLWHSLSPQEEEELSEGGVHPNAMASMHNVEVTAHVKTGRGCKTMEAKVNVAGPSARTIRRHIADSAYSCGTEVQIEALKKAKAANPSGRWFLKADATDMKEGLRESVKGKWTGDSDLGDGELQKAKKEYGTKLERINSLGLKTRTSDEDIIADLNEQITQFQEDAVFLANGIKETNKTYKIKLAQKHVPEQTLFALGWALDGFEKLLLMNRKLNETINDLLTLIHDQVEGVNIPRKLSVLRKELQEYIKGVSDKKRESASHLLVFMISDELRAKKPYAIPVRALPYKHITDDGLRKLRDEVITSMTHIGMVCVGFSTDGEFNSLRTMGNKRPVSVIQLMMDAKARARSTSVKLIEKYLTSVLDTDGKVHASKFHPAVPQEDLQWLFEFTRDVPFNRAIFILRRKQFPFFYDPYPWAQGKDETVADCLKSLMAHYLYRKAIADYMESGVNFKEHLYVPEKDENNGEPFDEREDHNHVLKRITSSTRSGSIQNIDLRAFVKCLKDPKSGLTYTALTGQHKQSVPDCERMFSRGVLEFMEYNNYVEEARFVRIVRNWHKASDGRGLSEEERSRYNINMLNYLLEDWMPWYRDIKEYSVMDVNRPIKGIRGFTREVIVALVANIESQEQRRSDYSARSLPPEHPRASATDDLECFFSILHHLLGTVFDHKTFLDNYRKIEQEFVKMVDPDLPFYYYTGVNERFQVGPIKSFNEPSEGKEERLDKVLISRRADPGVFVADRASIPQKGNLTIRAKFHMAPEELPPPIVHRGILD